MFGSTVLEVIAGMAFCYFSVSLIVSSVNEAIASFFKLRANTLLDAVKDMLNDPQMGGLALALYNHARVNPLGDGKATTAAELKYKPAYIPSRQFASALLDILRQSQQQNAVADLTDTIADPQLRTFLAGVLREAQGEEARVVAGLAQWFDHSMERVSGRYKQRQQIITFFVALTLAAVLNVDSLYLFHTLWTNGSIKPELYQNASADNAVQAIQNLSNLPLGWTDTRLASIHHVGTILLMLCGWGVTALAAMFGAPFWFDLLQKLIVLRGTGAKPDLAQPAADQTVAVQRIPAPPQPVAPGVIDGPAQ